MWINKKVNEKSRVVLMMKEKLLLIGSGGLGRVTSEHARIQYDCYFVDDAYEVGESICDVPVVGHIADLAELYKEYKKLVVTIGNNVLREKIYFEAKNMGYEFPNIISETAYVSPYAKIGQGCILLNNVVVQNGAHINDGVVLNPGVEIHHDSKIESNTLIYTNSVVRTQARIGKRVKVGSTCTISNNISVQDDTIIDDGLTISSNYINR